MLLLYGVLPSANVESHTILIHYSSLVSVKASPGKHYCQKERIKANPFSDDWRLSIIYRIEWKQWWKCQVEIGIVDWTMNSKHSTPDSLKEAFFFFWWIFQILSCLMTLLLETTVYSNPQLCLLNKIFKRILVGWSFPRLIREGLLFLFLTDPSHVTFLRKETVHDVWLGLFKHKQHPPSQAVWKVCSLHSQFPFSPPSFSLISLFFSALRLALHQTMRVHWSSLCGFNDTSNPDQL